MWHFKLPYRDVLDTGNAFTNGSHYTVPCWCTWYSTSCMWQRVGTVLSWSPYQKLTRVSHLLRGETRGHFFCKRCMQHATCYQSHHHQIRGMYGCVFSEQHYHTVDQLDFHVHLYDFSTKRNDGIEKPRVQMIVLCWKKDPSYLAFDFDELWTVSWCWCISNQSKIVQEFLI